MQLPEQSAPDGKWFLWDYQTRTVRPSAVAGGTGILNAELPSVPDNELWLLDRVVIRCTSTARTACNLYENTVDPSNILDGSLSGNFDVADNNSPLYLFPTTKLLFQWTAATVGSTASARCSWRVMRPNQ